MSDLPEDANPGDEELDLGEIDEAEAEEDGGEGDAGDAGDGDEGQEEEQQEDAGDVAAAPSGRQAGKRESQAQRLRRQLEETRQELAEAKGYRNASEQFRAQQSPQVDYAAQQRAQQERADRLAIMSPVEVAEFIANERGQQFQQALLQQQVTLQDRIDKQAYDQKAAYSKVRQDYRKRVEELVASERARGNVGVERESVLAYLRGQDQLAAEDAALARATRSAPAQRRAAARRVQGQQTRPTGARGDGASGSRRPAAGSAEDDERIIAEGFAAGQRL